MCRLYDFVQVGFDDAGVVWGSGAAEGRTRAETQIVSYSSSSENSDGQGNFSPLSGSSEDVEMHEPCAPGSVSVERPASESEARH